MTKNDVSWQKIHCACYTWIYEPIFPIYILPFAHNISLTETLGQATWSWWTIDAFCPTFSSLLYFSLFLLHWLSPTPFQPVSLTSVLAEPIWEHLAWLSHPAALGIPDPRCHCYALYRIPRLPCNRLPCHLDYPSHQSSLANFRCPKCFQVCYPCLFWLDDSWFSGFSRHLRLVFLLQGGPLQTKVVAKVIILTIWMQLHHHVERVSRRLWRWLGCPKCIQLLSSACFESEITSV